MNENECGSIGPEYQPKPLPDASCYIRLLAAKLCDDNGPTTLDCELTTWHIDSSPTFRAISYNWGDPAQTALLRVNGSTVTVTQNCETALLQASLCRPSGFRGPYLKKREICYLWCDAVCIDQRNQAEKEAQVAAMGRIYRRADHVIACLGPPVEGADSLFLFRKLRARSRQLVRIGEHWVSHGAEGEFHVDVARLTDDKWYQMVRLFLLSMSRRSIIRLCVALESLLGAPYFQRTWICQELFLGRRVSVCCGMYCAPISAMYGLAQASTLLSSSWVIRPVDCLWRLLKPWTPEQDLRRYDSRWTTYFLWLLSAGSSPNVQARSLGSLMWKIRYQECGDIRDKVYGTLSMVRWPDGEAICVDYGRDTFDLAVQVMEVIRKKPGGWDGRWYDVAVTVGRNLGLGTQPSEKLAAQIRRRKLHVSSPVGAIMGPKPAPEPPFAREPPQHDAYWGYRLGKTGTQWEFEGSFAPFRGLSKGRKVRIRSWSTVPPQYIGHDVSDDSNLDDVFLPPTAQPGDWCLMHSQGRLVFQLDSQLTAVSRYLSIDRAILLAREGCSDQHRRLSIIGKGLIHSGMAFTALEEPEATEFRVHLADDDALVLAATLNMIGDYNDNTRLVKPDKMDVSSSESATSCYFSTTVCSSPYSSYAMIERKKFDEYTT
jgi:hypothetical protein